MSYPTTVHLIGGGGGCSFSFTGEQNGARLEKIGVWVGGWQVRAVRVWLSDGRCETFGGTAGPYQEYAFKSDECFSSLTLWGNGEGSRLGAIKFKTNTGGEFFAKMTSWGLKQEYPMDVGSGICLGVIGNAGADVDCMGFVFLHAVQSVVLTDVNYPTLAQLIPKVTVEHIDSYAYMNDSSITQKQTVATSKKVTKKSVWSKKDSCTRTFNVTVKATIPKIVDVSAGYSASRGEESSYSQEHTEEKTETLTFPLEVPPKKKLQVDVTIGKATFDLPYTGTMKITCKNGSVLQYGTQGQYNGVTYTQIKVNTKEYNL